MIDILNKYLFQHSGINVPGLGTIFIERTPAKSDFVNRQIFPPEFIFRFDKYYDTPDKDFFAYLSSGMSIPDYEAIQEYNQFAQDFRSKIKLDDKAIWKDVGMFIKNSSGDIEFQQLPLYQNLYEPVIAERIVRSDTSHAILVGDQEKTNFEMTELLREKTNFETTALLNEDNQPKIVRKQAWPLYAIIFFAVAVIFLIFHFYKYGITLESISNRQQMELKQQK